MSWQDEWRSRAYGWIQRLNQIAHEWQGLHNHGVESALSRKRLALQVRDWTYRIVDTYLGGVDKLPNKVPAKSRLSGLGELGAIPQLAVGGAVLITAVSIGAWITNEEERIISAKAKLVRAIGEEARKATDPEVARRLAGVAERIDPNTPKPSGAPWLWLLGIPLAALGARAVLNHAREQGWIAG